MEPTIELLEKIYNAYSGAYCTPKDSMYYDVDGEGLGIVVRSHGYLIRVDLPVNLYGVRYPSYDKTQLGRISNAKKYFLTKTILILKPIFEITDEDASHCASLCGLHTAGNVVVRTQERILVSNDTYQLQISYNGYCCMRKNEALYNQDIRRVIDYLREKQYDMGHGSIKSLIEAEIADRKL